MNRYYAETEQLFRSQFREENGQLVFRQNGRAPPVPVTEQEMESCAAEFSRRLRLTTIPLAVASIVLVAALALVREGRLIESELGIWPVVGVIIVTVALAFRWAWHGTTATFKRRAPVSNHVRSRAELRAEMVSRWGCPEL